MPLAAPTALWLIVEFDECERVVIVHRYHKLVLNRVVAHRCRGRNTGCNDLSFLPWANARHAAEAHAADVLGAIVEYDEPVVAAFESVLRIQELTVIRIEGQHGIVADVDDDDVALRIDSDAIRNSQRRTFDVYSP